MSVEFCCAPYVKGLTPTPRLAAPSPPSWPPWPNWVTNSRRARSLPATKPHKLSLDRQEQLRRLAATGEPVSELAAAFGVGRATAYRYLAAANDNSFRLSASDPGIRQSALMQVAACFRHATQLALLAEIANHT